MDHLAPNENKASDYLKYKLQLSIQLLSTPKVIRNLGSDLEFGFVWLALYASARLQEHFPRGFNRRLGQEGNLVHVSCVSQQIHSLLLKLQ